MSDRINASILWVSLAICLLGMAMGDIRAAQPVQELEEVLVTGERPGPAMWRVSKGAHTLWIMGTLEPLPSRMTWRSDQVEKVIGESGEILARSVSDWDADTGFFESIGLLRAVLRLRHNADDATLREVLPEAVYQRWQAAHRRWYGKDPDPKERARPSYAADLLYERALRESGLTQDARVWPVVEKLARAEGVRIRRREFPVFIERPRELIDELKVLPRDREVACLVATLDYIDTKLPYLQQRAAAWAVGDLEALRALPAGNLRTDCQDALLENTRIGAMLREERAKSSNDWWGIVDWLLLTHRTSFTVLTIDELFDDSLLHRLRDKGYEVTQPR